MAKSYQNGYDAVYCYPNTHTLKNRLNIHDGRILFDVERKITSLRYAESVSINDLPETITLDYLKSLHKHLFDELYKWAGRFRTVDIAKGEMFCNSMFIKEQLQKALNELNTDEKLKQASDGKTTAERLAYHMSEINAIHPFREGNGRTQRLLIQKIAHTKGFELHFEKTTQTEMVSVSRASFMCNYEPMKDIFRKIILPLNENLP